MLFFIGGFIFDSLTLGRIDRLYDSLVLCVYMSLLTLVIYLYNKKNQGGALWRQAVFERFTVYFPLGIQFFFGGLSSAFVVYFSRSITPSKTLIFFILLIAVLIANEVLKKRISNKYLQFGFYTFISLTFFSFMIPVFIKKMNTVIFVASGCISLGITLLIIVATFGRKSLKNKKLIGLVLGVYALFNFFYFTNIIPPVPLSLEMGLIAHQVEKQNDNYLVTYEQDAWYVFWRTHRLKFTYEPGDRVYVFASIFAPTALKKKVAHRWKWLNPKTDEWEVMDVIGYRITGGRNGGYRGYTYKTNVKPGEWEVDVITEEGLIIGVISFKIVTDSTEQPHHLEQRVF